MFSLAGRVALITGAASGIGAATARVYAEAGADLALAWYPPDGHDIEPVRRAAEKEGRKVVVAEVDVTKVADVEALVAQAVRELGGMHIVVANAGIARKVELADLDDAAWRLRVRERVAPYDRDRFLAPDIEAVAEMVGSGALLQTAAAVCGTLE